MAPAFGVLFYAAGILIKNSKRNYFIGIRTPWTLQSDEVWGRTHRRGSLLFRAAGVIAALGVILPEQAIWLLLAPVGVFTIYIVIYSYLEYKKVKPVNN
jgi:uncharacterized membrane protein